MRGWKMITDRLVAMVGNNEGFRPTAYVCPAGRLTIGFGTNLEAGITKEEGELLLRSRLAKLYGELERYEWFPALDYPRRAVLVDLAYNLGLAGLMGFSRMIDAIKREAWDEAAAHLLDSKYARKDVPNRARRNAEILRTGGWGK
jgi:lysozyme